MNANLFLNVVVFPASLLNGMAATRRIRNFTDNWASLEGVKIRNLAILHPLEFDKKGQSGELDTIEFKNLGFKVSKPFSILRLLYDGYNYLKRSYSKGSQNILYQYGNPDLISFLVIKIARHIGYKILLDIVEDNSLIKTNFSSFLGKWNTKISIVIEKYTVTYTDVCIVISPYLEKKFLSLVKNQIPVVYFPISVNFNNESNIKLLKKNKEIRIFYGGSFGIKDGLEYLITAFIQIHSEIPGTELILTGKGSERDMVRINHLISGAMVDNSIRFLGFLTWQEYNDVIFSSDIMCMTRINSPYANAGFPFKLGEMLATGNPVICTNVGDVTQYLNDKESAVLIEPESVQSLIEAIRFLILNPDEGKKIGTKGRKVAEHSFDAKVHSKKLYDLILSI